MKANSYTHDGAGAHLRDSESTTHISIHTRTVSAAEVPGVAAFHLVAFGGFYLSALGPRFLELYYRKILEYPGVFAWGHFTGRASVVQRLASSTRRLSTHCCGQIGSK